MPVAFTDLLAAVSRDGDYRRAIPDDWMQGRTTYGGLTAALCLDAALTAHAGLPPLRSAQVAFVGPAAGEARVETSVLRAGRSVTFINADLLADGGLATRAVFAFGAERASAFDVRHLPFPDGPGPEESEPFFGAHPGPPFAQHYEVRLARGARPVTGSAEREHHLWVRHRDARARGVVALLALADMPPPAAMPMFTAPAPISSMTWLVNCLAPDPDARDGWFLIRTAVEDVARGYSSQDMTIWTRDGAPVIAARQSVAVFA